MSDPIAQTADPRPKKRSRWRWIALLGCLFVGLWQLLVTIAWFAKRGTPGRDWGLMCGSLSLVPVAFILFRTVLWWRREEGKARWVFYSFVVFAWPIGMQTLGTAFPWLTIR